MATTNELKQDLNIGHFVHFVFELSSMVQTEPEKSKTRNAVHSKRISGKVQQFIEA